MQYNKRKTSCCCSRIHIKKSQTEIKGAMPKGHLCDQAQVSEMRRPTIPDRLNGVRPSSLATAICLEVRVVEMMTQIEIQGSPQSLSPKITNHRGEPANMQEKETRSKHVAIEEEEEKREIVREHTSRK